MPDFSMCSGIECPQKKDCLRYTSTPKVQWQSWFNKPPAHEITGDCEYFIPTNEHILKGLTE